MPVPNHFIDQKEAFLAKTEEVCQSYYTVAPLHANARPKITGPVLSGTQPGSLLGQAPASPTPPCTVIVSNLASVTRDISWGGHLPLSLACLAPNRANAEKRQSLVPKWYNMHFDSFLRQIYALSDCFWWLSRMRNFVALKPWLKLGCFERRVTLI